MPREDAAPYITEELMRERSSDRLEIKVVSDSIAEHTPYVCSSSFTNLFIFKLIGISLSKDKRAIYIYSEKNYDKYTQIEKRNTVYYLYNHFLFKILE